MANSPTKNQILIMNGVFALHKMQRKWPTYRELAEHTGFPLSYVHASVRSLVKKGRLSTIPKKHRGIRGPK